MIKSTYRELGILLMGVLVLGCGSVDKEAEKEVPVQTESVSPDKKQVVESSPFKDFDAFYGAIVFRGGDAPEADYIDQLDYEHPDKGIVEFYPKKYYDRYKRDKKALAARIKELSEATQVFWVGTNLRPASVSIHDYLHEMVDGHMPNARQVIEENKGKDLAELSLEDKQSLLYAYTLRGEYEEAEKLEQKMCGESEDGCPERVDFIIKGQVEDEEGNPISGAMLSVLNYNQSFVADDAGNFDETISVRNPDKIRVRISMDGFSDVFLDEYVTTAFGESGSMKFSVVLSEPIGALKIDTGSENLEVFSSDGAVEYVKVDNGLEVTVEDKFSFVLPKEVIFAENGEQYDGVANLELFHFSSNDRVKDVFWDLDIVSDGFDLLDEGIVAFGMPYIKLSNGNGDRLEVRKENPIVIESFMRNYAGEKGLPEFLSESQWQKIYDYGEASDETFPINWEAKQELLGGATENGKFGLLWNLRQDVGVWESGSYKLLNTEGDFKTQFYTHE